MHSRQLFESTSTIPRRPTFLRWLLSDHINRFIARCTLYAEVKRERETLAKLSDEALRDIGVHRAEADAESRRAFHDLPADRADLYESFYADSHAVQHRREM